MSAMSEIRANYDHCIEMMEQATTKKAKAYWRELARAWELLAS